MYMHVKLSLVLLQPSSRCQLCVIMIVLLLCFLPPRAAVCLFYCRDVTLPPPPPPAVHRHRPPACRTPPTVAMTSSPHAGAAFVVPTAAPVYCACTTPPNAWSNQKQSKPIIMTDKDVDKIDDEELLHKMVTNH